MGRALIVLVCTLTAAAEPVNVAISGPLTVSSNRHYFKSAQGQPIILNGSHTWNTLQDWGSAGSVRPVDFAAFTRFLNRHGHNFTLLWYTELPKFCWFPSTPGAPPEVAVGPHPWVRTGP